MPHRDTSVAIKQAIYISIPNDGDNPTCLYITTGFQCFNATQGHKPSYTTSHILIRNYTLILTSFFLHSTFILPWFYLDSTLIRPSLYPHSSFILPTFYLHSTLILPWFYPDSTFIIPSFFLHSSYILPSFYPDSTFILPSFYPDSTLIIPLR